LARQIAPADCESRETYAHAKTDFIERIIAKALKNGYPRKPPRSVEGVALDRAGPKSCEVRR
jgi:hypothetical protein